MADNIEKNNQLVKAKTSSLQKRDSNIVSRGLSDLGLLDVEGEKRIKFSETGVSCCIDHFGIDAPEVFSEGTTIYINRDHPIYKRESAKVDTHRVNIARLITQETSSFNITIREKILQEWFEKGNKHYLNNEYDKAIEAYTLAIALDPTNAETYRNRGRTYFKKNQYNRAIEDYNKAIAIDPNYAKAYNNRGVVYEKFGNNRMAISDYRKACDLGLELGCENLQRVLRQK